MDVHSEPVRANCQTEEHLAMLPNPLPQDLHIHSNALGIQETLLFDD